MFLFLLLLLGLLFYFDFSCATCYDRTQEECESSTKVEGCESGCIWVPGDDRTHTFTHFTASRTGSHTDRDDLTRSMFTDQKTTVPRPTCSDQTTCDSCLDSFFQAAEPCVWCKTAIGERCSSTDCGGRGEQVFSCEASTTVLPSTTAISNSLTNAASSTVSKVVTSNPASTATVRATTTTVTTVTTTMITPKPTPMPVTPAPTPVPVALCENSFAGQCSATLACPGYLPGYTCGGTSDMCACSGVKMPRKRQEAVDLDAPAGRCRCKSEVTIPTTSDLTKKTTTVPLDVTTNMQVAVSSGTFFDTFDWWVWILFGVILLCLFIACIAVAVGCALKSAREDEELSRADSSLYSVDNPSSLFNITHQEQTPGQEQAPARNHYGKAPVPNDYARVTTMMESARYEAVAVNQSGEYGAFDEHMFGSEDHYAPFDAAMIGSESQPLYDEPQQTL